MAIKRITTNLIKDSDIATVDIANNAITAAKITDGNITTAKLADLSVTAGKLAGTLDLTGKTITVATATTGDNDTSPASTAFVQQEIAALVDSSPDSLNTLNELAAALGDDASFSTTVTNSIALKAPLASPDFTGDTTFDTDTLVVDATNNRVGIGTTSPSAKLHVANAATEEFLFETTSNNTRSQVEVKSKDSSGNAVQTRIASMGDGAYGMLYTLTNHNLTFATNNAAPQMTLDTSGNLLVGKTATGGNTAGMQIIAGSFFSHVRDGGVVQVLNRKTSDGDILKFEKDNLTVGVIASKLSTSGSVMIIGTGDTGIAFENLVLRPRETDNGTSDGAIDLGTSDDRFKDLYLSGKAKTAGADFSGQVQHFAGNVSTYFRADNARYGQIFMDNDAFNIRGWTGSSEPIKINAAASGGPILLQSASTTKVRIDGDGLKFNSDTAAANALDDYEEGTFSPTLANAYNITSLTLSEAGRYTKVGSLVHFEFQVTGSFTNSAVESRFSFTVPFNIATSSSRATGMFSHHLTSFSNGRFNNGQIFQGTTVDTATWVYISTNQLSGTGSFTGRGTFTYVAA